jgi:hypothetical protein
VDIFLDISNNPAEMKVHEPQKLASEMKRMTRIASKIEEAGLPVKLMTVGLTKGDPGTVELFFRPHFQYNPKER